jgi:hypothetical protein
MERIEITKSNYKDYVSLDIVAFSFASPGAMGDSGAIIVVTKDGCVYRANPFFEDVSEEEVFQVCPPLKNCQFGMFGGGNIPEGWQSYYLGCGNHLVIRDDISAQFSAIIEREEFKKMGAVYQKWIDIVFEIIKVNPTEKSGY